MDDKITKLDNLVKDKTKDKRKKKHGRGKKSDWSRSDVYDVRYRASRGAFLNLTNLLTKPTIEFRWMAGTLNSDKVLSGLFICEFIANRAWATKRYSDSCTSFAKNKKIHGGDPATLGRRGLNYLMSDFRNTKEGRKLYYESERRPSGAS